MHTHPIIHGGIPDTILFFDLSSNQLDPEIIKVHNLSKLVSLGTLKTLSIEPSNIINHSLSPVQIQKQLDVLYSQIANHPFDLYYVLMASLLNLQINNNQEAMDSFDYLAEILKSQNEKFLDKPDNKIVCALTGYFLHCYKLSDVPLIDVWKSIKPTLMVEVNLPSESKYYITQVIFKCATTRIFMIETEPGCYMLPAGSLSRIMGNKLKLQVFLDTYTYFTDTEALLDVHFILQYGFIHEDKYNDKHSVKLA